jgi:CTP synthase (UTP-ammonia lyase)
LTFAGLRVYAAPVLSIAIVADYDPALPSHDATDAALRHAAHAIGVNFSAQWLPTDILEASPAAALKYARGIMIGPGSPYVSMQGALNAIQIARESGRPLLGTCGGFQHIVIEYARDVLGIADADHAEYDPAATRALIRALPCSLAGKTLQIDLAPGSLARRIYGQERIEEKYHCTFGLDPAYRARLEAAGLQVTGVEAGGAGADAESVGEARIVELPSHPFFVGTLFVPQMRSNEGAPHPMIRAFVQATIDSKVPVDERPVFDEEVEDQMDAEGY